MPDDPPPQDTDDAPADEDWFRQIDFEVKKGLGFLIPGGLPDPGERDGAPNPGAGHDPGDARGDAG